MGRGTWYYSLGVSSIIDAFVRVDGRSYLLSGATNSSEANGIIRNPKLELESFCFTFDLVPFSCGKRLVHGDDVAKIVFRMRNGHVQVYGYAFWVNQCTSGFHGVNEQAAEGREGVREFFQQHRSEAKRMLSREGRNQMGNEPVIALLEGADDFIVYYDARSKDLEVYLVEERGRLLSRWMKLFNEYGFEAKYHLGKANVVVESWSRKKSEAKNKFWIDVTVSWAETRDSEIKWTEFDSRIMFLFDELRDRVVNDVVTQLKVLTRFLDDGRGGIGNQFIESDHLNEIGLMVKFVEFISFTLNDKEMIIEVLAFCVKC
ncbi:hypothetical protein Tco_0133484, partial [Tanacetum coccineum]